MMKWAIVLLFCFASAVPTICADSRDDTVAEVKRIFVSAQSVMKKTQPNKQFYKQWNGSKSSDWIAGKPADDVQATMVVRIWNISSEKRVVDPLTNTPSGDWFSDNEYYFYDEGTVAFIFSTYKTLTANVAVDRRYYFATNGEPVRYLLKITDLQSGKEIPFADASYPDFPPILYLNIFSLLSANGVPD